MSISARAAANRENARKNDGRFGHQNHERADVTLTSARDLAGGEQTEPPWDPKNIPGWTQQAPDLDLDETPAGPMPGTWGGVNQRWAIAPGITEVACQGHGGIGLSKARNALVPKALRRKDGWYEEDADYAIAVATFPEEFSRSDHPAYADKDAHQVEQDALGVVVCWNPGGFEKATGAVIPKGVSREKDSAQWYARHEDHYVNRAAILREDGRVDVHLHRRSDGATTWVVMDSQDYRSCQKGEDSNRGKFAIADLTGHEISRERIKEEQREV